MDYYKKRWADALQNPTVQGMIECPMCGNLITRNEAVSYATKGSSRCCDCSNGSRLCLPSGRHAPSLGLAEEASYDDEDTGFDFVPPIAAHFDHAARHEDLRGLKSKRRSGA